MRKLTIFAVIWLILLSLVYLLHSEDQSTVNKKSDVNNRIKVIVEKYGDRAFKSFYSLEELRPYSILQVDHICDLYGDTWLSPTAILKKLTKEDKELLTKSIGEYIDSFDDINKQNFVIARIINWCKADMQFSFLNKDLDYFQENVFTAMMNVNKINQYSNLCDYKSAEIEVLNSEQNDYTYYQTLNVISALALPEQLRFYGDIYYQLATLNKK